MKNIMNIMNSKVIEIINDIAENIAEKSVTSCGLFGAYEIEIPLELINQQE